MFEVDAAIKPASPAPVACTLPLEIEPILLDAVIRGTREGLEMTGLNPPPIGASRYCTASRAISVVVGLVGRTNGSVTLSMGERTMLHIASKLLGEEHHSIDEMTFDAIGEVGNMIGGRVKEVLIGTPYESENISVPSVIMGQSYNVHYTRGMHTLSVDFELTDMPFNDLKERFFTTSLALLRRVSG
ncbi:MAG: chemotaxis protein CheX [Planctomycetes bacterium]|nr:chemotaxis protein CheX [Planctomycetota bacterium]